ncbi:hypothetical protein CR513_49450, partial [Mucuna pruriens]
MDRSMIDVANGGALNDKTPIVARHLISNMASNTLQFGIRGPSQSRMVNEIGAASNLRLENQLSELTSLVRKLAVGQHQPNMAAKVCGICTSMKYPTDLCPTLQETESDQPENVGAIGGYQYGKHHIRTSHLIINIEFAIPNTTFPIAATIENATLRQFFISRGPDEATCSQQFRVSAICKLQQHAVPTKYERHNPRPQHVDRTVSQHCDPFIVGSIQQPSLTNNSESERERKCIYAKKWKRTILTSTIATEINRSRLRTGCQLIGAATRENYPIVVSNSDCLGKEIRV